MAGDQAAYLYGIVSAQTNPQFQLWGVGNPPWRVHQVPIDSVSLLISYLEEDPSELGIEDAVKHVKVLEAALQSGPVIPVRFGTITQSLAKVKQVIQSNLMGIQKELEGLTGKFEVGVKAYWKKEALLRELSGRYPDHPAFVLRANHDRSVAIELGQRVESLVEEWRKKVAAHLHPEILRLASANQLNASPSPEMIYNAAFLVTPSQEMKLQQALEAFADKHSSEYEFHYTTRLPPYSFTKIKLS
ncbi:MAG TPA: GvpL/GvpF family gas vesicle protein [Bacillota bacterium]|nr:GvpL/GvpF family gas vesicle protein [Bacillota bacterium]